MREEVTGETFPTILTNRRKAPVQVFELDGTLLETIDPAQEKVLEAATKDAFYAQFSEIRWDADGSVKAVERKGFRRGDLGAYPLTILNVGGRHVERRMIDGQLMTIPQGIPITIGLGLDAPEIRRRELRIVKVDKMVRSESVPGFYAFGGVGIQMAYSARANAFLDHTADLSEGDQ